MVTEGDVALLSIISAQVILFLLPLIEDTSSGDVLIECDEFFTIGRNIYTVVLYIVGTQVSCIELKRATKVNLRANQPFVNTQGSASVFIHADRSQAWVAIGSGQGYTTHRVLGDGQDCPVTVVSPTGGNLNTLEALIQVGLHAVAHVVARGIAVPSCIGALSSDILYCQVGGQREPQRSNKCARFAPLAHVLGRADRANVSGVSRVLLQTGELQGGYTVNVDGLNLIRIECVSAVNHLPEVLLLGAGNPIQGSTIINDVGGIETTGTRASVTRDREGGEYTRSGNGAAAASAHMLVDDITAGIHHLEAALISIVAVYPNEVIILAVAQGYRTCGIIAWCGQSELGNHSAGVVINDLQFVAVPAVTVGVV